MTTLCGEGRRLSQDFFRDSCFGIVANGPIESRCKILTPKCYSNNVRTMLLDMIKHAPAQQLLQVHG